MVRLRDKHRHGRLWAWKNLPLIIIFDVIIIITMAFCPADKIRVHSTVDKCDSAQVGPSGDSTSEKTDKTDRGVGSIASDEAHQRKTAGRSPDTSLQHGACFVMLKTHQYLLYQSQKRSLNLWKYNWFWKTWLYNSFSILSCRWKTWICFEVLKIGLKEYILCCIL